MDASFLQDEKVCVLLKDQIIYFLVVESPLRFLYYILHFPVIECSFSIAIQDVTHVNFSNSWSKIIMDSVERTKDGPNLWSS